jgi:hypothetical protein
MTTIDTPTSPPPDLRPAVLSVVILTSVALLLGVTLKAPSQVGANDISRWCTVWSLLERGTYQIDECPWQYKTQDKVKKPDPFATVAPGQTAPEHFYSSKPPLLPTLIAGILYPIHRITGVPLDREVTQARQPRNVEIRNDDGTSRFELQTPKDPAIWPVYVFYFKPILVLFNVVPMAILLVLYGRFLFRHAPGTWPWLISLFGTSFGLLTYSFHQTLNNHSIAAYSAFFALYSLLRIYEDDPDRPQPLHYALAGFFGAFTACNEVPAALFGILLFLALLIRSPRQTLIAFVPAAAVPVIAFFATQYLAMGTWRLAYEDFGTRSYRYEGSFWNTPLEMDWFNDHPESYPTYLFHMTFGHHGVFSLTPLFLFSVYGAGVLAGRRGALRPIALMTLVLTITLIGFYLWNPKARNYGGSTNGLRWLFWLIPFWILTLPEGLRATDRRRSVRTLALTALAFSVLSVGYSLRGPWTHPWILDMLEHLDLYSLVR